MSKLEITSAMQGHNRMIGRWEKQAKRDGAGSKAHNLYTHHLIKWLELNQKLEEA